MPWHFILESLAYVVAFRLYVQAREKTGDFLDTTARWTVVVAAVAGAALGSRVLFWAEDPAVTMQRWNDLGYLMGGKTIVGALLGGTVGVELVKRRMGIRRRTGDLFAVPLSIGIAIGRIGCLMAGTEDDTYGVATAMPWGVDLGDGVRRHPVQLYETAAMVMLAAVLSRVRAPRFGEGDRYRVFVFSYFAWRVGVDFLKPGVRFGGLTVLQWASAAAALWYAKDMVRMMAQKDVAYG